MRIKRLKGLHQPCPRFAAGLFCLALLATACSPGRERSQAQTVVYIVRHAEKATDKDATDPPLTASGRRRAQDLRKTLRSVKLDAIYATQYKRTRETVAPTAELMRIKPIFINSEKTAQLAASLRGRARGEMVLVGAHSNTVPLLLKALGVKERVSIGSGDYDHLFVVLLAEKGPPALLRLHYGVFTEPTVESARKE